MESKQKVLSDAEEIIVDLPETMYTSFLYTLGFFFVLLVITIILLILVSVALAKGNIKKALNLFFAAIIVAAIDGAILSVVSGKYSQMNPGLFEVSPEPPHGSLVSFEE